MIYQGLAAFCLVFLVLAAMCLLFRQADENAVAPDWYQRELAFLNAEGVLDGLCQAGPEYATLRRLCVQETDSRFCVLPLREFADGTTREWNGYFYEKNDTAWMVAAVAELGHENTVYVP